MSETLSLTDSISSAVEVILSETLSLADTISKSADISLSETLSLTDTISKEADIPMSETLSLTDTISRAQTTSVSLSETLSLADTISKSADISLSETLSLTVVVTIDGTTNVELSETLSLADTIYKAVDIPMSETLSLTDILSSTAEVLLSETLSFTDTVSRAGANSISLTETLQLSDNPSVPTNLVALDAEGFGGEYVETFTLTGTYAGTYAIATGGSVVRIIDVSDPTNIVQTDIENDGLNGFTEIDGAHGIDIFTIGSSTYAIVTAEDDDGVQIIDVSNPSAIVAKGSLTDNSSLILGDANHVDTFTIGSSTYAIVVSGADHGAQIIDVSDPANIVAKDTLVDTNSLELRGAYAVETFTLTGTYAGTYAIVASWTDAGVQIIDVSDPANIVALDAETDGVNGFNVLESPGHVDVFTIGSSTYAIVTAFNDQGVQIIDVSNPTDIVAKDTLVDTNLLELIGAHGVDTFTIGSSTYAIVTGYLDDGVQIIDVSDPANIVALDAETDGVNGFTALDGAHDADVFTIGLSTYAIVVSLQSGRTQMIELSTDEGFVKQSINISLSETLSLTDSISSAVEVILSETLSLADTISKSADISHIRICISDWHCFYRWKLTSVSISETLSLTDTISKAQTGSVSMSETLSLADRHYNWSQGDKSGLTIRDPVI